MTAVIIFTCLVVWTVLGLLLFHLYACSTVELHVKLELLLAGLCGPVVWYVLVSSYRKAAVERERPPHDKD